MAGQVHEDRRQALLDLTRSWRIEGDIDALLARVVKEAVEFLGLQRGALLLLSGRGLEVRSAWPEPDGPGGDDVRRLSLEIGRSVVQAGRPVVGHELREAETQTEDEAPAVRAVYCVPMTGSGGVLGALYADSTESASGAFQEVQDLIETLALHAAEALEGKLSHRAAATHSPARHEGGTDESAGTEVDGHTVLRRLYADSASETLLVRQPGLEREVALKRPLTAFLEPDQARAFEQEARAAAALNHPGVVTVYTIGRDADGRQYYTMEPLEGQSLTRILEDRRKGDVDKLLEFTHERLLEILQRVAETVAYVHGQGVVHPGLTPSNIIVGGFGEVTVIDWGLGAGGSGRAGGEKGGGEEEAPEPVEGPSPPALLVGVPEYAAPEQLPGATAGPGPESDVFSMGAVLYEILTGRPPYRRDTVQESVSALREGKAPPPEEVAPDEGIEPSLSALCMSSLLPDPSRRPSALEFAERLGRHVRREREWEVTRFGAEDTPLIEEEWSALVGQWTIEDGEWVTQNDREGLLVWRKPVPGDFHFICEAWVEEKGELSIIGHGPKPDADAQHKYEGYCFQFGAEDNCTTKMARQAEDVLAVPGETIEPGRRHRLEMSYQDGRARCFLDGRQIFVYREFVPLHGNTIGFYAYAAGTHFRPIEVRKENWGLSIPAVRLADDLLRHGFNEVALERYTELAERNPQRLEGCEARLKAGVCLARLYRMDEAREVFQSLRDTPMEPYAMAEEAALDFEEHGDMQPARGIEILRRLDEQYPDNQATARIMELARSTRLGFRSPMFSFSLTEDYEIRTSIQRIGQDTLRPPSLSQIEFHYSLTAFELHLAQWKAALDDTLDFWEALRPQQETKYDLPVMRLSVALANGREDLVPAFPLLEGYYGIGGRFEWQWDAEAHWMVRSADPQAHLDDVRRLFEDSANPGPRLRLGPFLGCLVNQEPDSAGRFFHEHVLPTVDPKRIAAHTCYWYGASIAGARLEGLLEDYLGHLEDNLPTDSRSMVEDIIPLLRARWALEAGNMEKAARHLEGWPYSTAEWHHVADHKQVMWDACLFQVLLASLGVLKTPKMDELEPFIEHHLTGVRLDMAGMFLGAREPRPNDLWPHPGWCPHWRLWLALWLEAKGDEEGAREVVTPALDERYGLAHSQPALRNLLDRVSR